MNYVAIPRSLRRPLLGLIAISLCFSPVTGCSSDLSEEPQQNESTDGDADTETNADTGSNGDDNGVTNSEEPDADDNADDERPDENSGEDWDWGDDDFGIDAVVPARGPIDGGTEVHIQGSDLSDGTELLFGDQPVDSELTQGQLVAQTPPADTAGPITVRAISADGEESVIEHGYTYADHISLDDIVPSILPDDGGFEIDLHGQGFNSPMGVSFGGQPALDIDVINDNLARVVVPPVDAGYADVRVVAPDAEASVEDGVYFFPPLDIDTVEPAAGTTAGGATIALYGAGLTDDTSVTIGGREATVESLDIADGIITATTPPADEPGSADITVSNDYDTLILSDAFYYDDDSADNTLYSVQPPTAPVDGGTEHVVSGRGLDNPEAAIVVDGQPATIVEAGAAHARIEAPSTGGAITADVSLEIDGTEVDRLDDALNFVVLPAIDDVSPASGDTDGSQSVTIEGSGFDGVDGVTFGGVAASFTVESDQIITATAPALEPGAVDVTVTAGDHQTTKTDAFTYEGPLEIWSLSPSRGSVAGNTWVTVLGRGFIGAIDATIGDDPAYDIRRHDPYTVTFRTPPSSSSGPQPVTVESAERQAEPDYPFVYFNPTSSFGGAYGSPTDGALNVSVLNVDGSPVPDAFVTLSNQPDTPFRGYTDDQGRITISGPGVVGPQTIHATAADMSTVTIRDVDARNVTVVLNPLDPPEGDPGEIAPPPMAHFEGIVSIEGKQANPEGAPEYNMSIVDTTRSAVGASSLTPGDDSVVEGEGEYEIRTSVGDVALVAFCGYYDDESEHFTPKTMAVERNLSVSDGQRLEVDLECDIALDQTLPIQISDPIYAPDGPTSNEITTYLDFGFEGVIAMPNPTIGLGSMLMAGNLPATEGILDNLTYSVVAGSYTDGGLPYSRTTLEDIPDTDQIYTTPPLVAVPELLAPAPGQVADDVLWIGQRGSNDPDLHHLVLSNDLGLPAWTFIAPGDDHFIPMPQFPEFSELPDGQRPAPYDSDPAFTTAYGAQIDGFDYNAFTWADLEQSAWTSFAVDTWDISLSD